MIWHSREERRRSEEYRIIFKFWWAPPNSCAANTPTPNERWVLPNPHHPNYTDPAIKIRVLFSKTKSRVHYSNTIQTQIYSLAHPWSRQIPDHAPATDPIPPSPFTTPLLIPSPHTKWCYPHTTSPISPTLSSPKSIAQRSKSPTRALKMANLQCSESKILPKWHRRGCYHLGDTTMAHDSTAQKNWSPTTIHTPSNMHHHPSREIKSTPHIPPQKATPIPRNAHNPHHQV